MPPIGYENLPTTKSKPRNLPHVVPLNLPPTCLRKVFSVSFSSNGLLLATCSADHTAKVWSCKTYGASAVGAHGSARVLHGGTTPKGRNLGAMRMMGVNYPPLNHEFGGCIFWKSFQVSVNFVFRETASQGC